MITLFVSHTEADAVCTEEIRNGLETPASSLSSTVRS